MSKKLVGGTLGSVLDSYPEIINGMIKVHAKLVNIYPKMELQAMAVHEPKKNLQHFMLESVVEAQDSYVYVSSRFIMDLDEKVNLKDKFYEFHDHFTNQCENIKNNYKE